MFFPIDWGELSTLLALAAITLLLASELISPYNRGVSILFNKQRLRRVAIIFSISFIITVGIKAYEIILSASSS